MIYRLKVNDPTNAVCHWWNDVEWLKGRSEIEFGPGLNILFGGNGSGKSTVLATIAKLLCCYDGDAQVVGQHTGHDLHTRTKDGKSLKLGLEPIHDGSPVIHFDPSQTVGLIGGGFDWDFGDAGLRNTMFKGSAGQTCMMRMNKALAIAFGKIDWPEVVWNGTNPDFSPELATFFKGDGNRVRPTLIMDEPSSNLDLRTEIMLFKALQKIADAGVQVIVATHSVFALHMDGAKYIDTVAGYSTHAKIDVEAHFLAKLMKRPERLKLMMDYIETVEEADKPKPCKCGRKTCDGATWEQVKLIALERYTAEFGKYPGTKFKAGDDYLCNVPDESRKPTCTMTWGVKHRKTLKAAKVGDEVVIEMNNWHPATRITLRKITKATT